MIAAAIVFAAAAAAPAVAPTTVATPALSAVDEAAIMQLLCDGELSRDARGWVCRDEETIDGNGPWEQRWHSAWPGRFIQHANEWLVTRFRTCDFRYCPFDSHVVRKVRAKWQVVKELEMDDGPGPACVRLAGGGTALDRLACLDASGPNQGFLFERLRVLSFAGGEVSEQLLLAHAQGGECFLDPPEKEMRADEVEIIGDDGKTLTVSLKIQAAPCDAATPEGHGAIVARGAHVLRFVREGERLVPDAATKELIERHAWLEPI
jgi:hypothetical protein